jgi:hypothetical protein
MHSKKCKTKDHDLQHDSFTVPPPEFFHSSMHGNCVCTDMDDLHSSITLAYS